MEGTAPLQGCLARLRGIFPALTAAEGRVAETILENPQQIIHLSITELADRANSAEATIFRLCKRLGYGGYQSFKIALASDLVTPMQNIHEAIGLEDSLHTIVAKVFHSNMEALQDTLKVISEEGLQQTVEALNHAPRIEFYGLGGSAPIAMDRRSFLGSRIRVATRILWRVSKRPEKLGLRRSASPTIHAHL
ncbi:MAG: MurR/RpiR family transcriptional regulator [Desulfitobacteriaceae bacterium]|nr:MurR/RpiR family transcriptional regulator [Desulfitobacteriaceae bacterium]MDI6880415.1 MurR/RpiR family transcriptional regulator [Desulfitobacteriaceae bacterium]MDI6914272.1 MurR/RpiR family transcriptional regulator [Desulfitobacteriaceae bacterium]